MAKIDAYLRSIEKFGAAGAILSSGQAVTLRFPQGDRQATQITPHDQLVPLVREVAPPGALEQLDKNRPAQFDFDSNGLRYTLSISPRPGAWQVTIASAGGSAPQTVPIPRQPSRAATAPTVGDADMVIERGPYTDEIPARTTSGSAMLDQWTNAARSARATDVWLATGATPVMRINGELQPIGERVLDAETIARELGVVAPAEARGKWTERGVATFTYSDGIGRIRATLTRDHRGPGASLRLLVGEPPTLERLGLTREVGTWLDQRGLLLVAGASGSGKTTTLAALVRALVDRHRRVVTFEDPIEIVHAASSWISQRAIREHVPSVGEAVAGAMYEGADAIVIGAIANGEAAAAALDAVYAGHLVLATVAANARMAVEHVLDLLAHDKRDRARIALDHAVVGTIAPLLKGSARTFEVIAGRSG